MSLEARDRKDPNVKHFYPGQDGRQHVFRAQSCWCKPALKYKPGTDALNSVVNIEHREAGFNG